MTGSSSRGPRLPPRWFVVLFWRMHRTWFRVTGGRRGVWPPRPGKWGSMRLTTTGRRSGQQRSVMLAYLEDGPDVVAMAMNGWNAAEPAWWLNLQAQPKARVRLAEGERDVLARRATGEERDRLWERFRALDEELDGLAEHRSTETAVVVFEPVRNRG